MFIIFLALAGMGFADPVLPNLFSDHMVVQQGREIHVWGKADPSEVVNVTFAGRSAHATTDAHGDWSVHLPSMTAGGPFTLVVRGKKEITVKDVMIGEVWIASGQSNMTYSLGGAENAATEVPKANYPQIRLFTVPKKIALTPQENTLPAHWEICTPDTAKNFSAVAYFFAREIQRKLNVPVGVVESAWPGTAIQTWISPEVLRADADLKNVFDEWDRSSPEQKHYAESAQPFNLEFDDFELVPTLGEPASKLLANFDDGTSRLTTGGAFSYSWTESPDATFDLVSPGRGSSGFSARVAGKLDGTNDSILAASYSLDGSPEDLSAYAGIRFWVRGNGSFRFRSKQPAITDYDDYATPVLKATAEWRPITVPFHDLHQDGWGVVKDFTPAALTGFSLECLTSLEYAPMPVSGLYEGMITPLLPYGFRGALWYQGESNAWKPYQYRKLLPALIQNWRDASHQPDLDFLIVQLPNHGAIPVEPGESAWAEVREAQLMTVQHVPHTGLAVTIDVGDPNDLHPHRKMEVGERLAAWALGTTYRQAIEPSGPLYHSMQIQGGEVHLHFEHVGSGLEARGDAELQGFAVAGADHKFHWADAHIAGDTVVVSSRDVAKPVAVRYAWGDSPPCNLFNKEGLPASPFRTDDWPGITDVK
ncbi:MAG TPA: sialate O-acetylesterase [Candidatus Dormibacteraeota bacterium]|nr:sialate O-acetylesterase [Candidatus Dormibacteraeota bacterium]